jgi:hypothetical protein
MPYIFIYFIYSLVVTGRVLIFSLQIKSGGCYSKFIYFDQQIYSFFARNWVSFRINKK